nr:LPS export ABC transporter periplasmic protein LptC [Alphaproteobacteria bacterium]
VTEIRLPSIDKAQITGDRTELVNPRYEGQDEGGQRFVLTAERAIQSRATPDEVVLVAPAAALTNDDNSEGTRVIARQGTYQDKAELLNLTDDVTMTTPEGDSFITSAADIDLKNKIVTGKMPVTGSGPRVDLSAQGFVYDHAGQRLTLTGPARLVLKETDEKNNPDPAAPAAD